LQTSFPLTQSHSRNARSSPRTAQLGEHAQEEIKSFLAEVEKKLPEVKKSLRSVHCPDCYGLVVDKDGVPVEHGYLENNKRSCSYCGGALWQADNTGIRRFPLSEYVKKYMKGYFDYLIADEVHELKGGSTAQGNSFGALSSACGKTLALTGTLVGGYADDVFYVLYRLSPEAMKEEDLGYGSVSGWMARYGVPERVTKSYPQDNRYSNGYESSAPERH
jgi:hypothetical protein